MSNDFDELRPVPCSCDGREAPSPEPRVSEAEQVHMYTRAWNASSWVLLSPRDSQGVGW